MMGEKSRCAPLDNRGPPWYSESVERCGNTSTCYSLVAQRGEHKSIPSVAALVGATRVAEVVESHLNGFFFWQLHPDTAKSGWYIYSAVWLPSRRPRQGQPIGEVWPAHAENRLGTPPGSQSGGGSSAANSQRFINDLGVGAIRLWPGGRTSQTAWIAAPTSLWGLLLMGDTSAGRRQGGSCICKGLLRLRGRVLVG